MKFPFSLKPRTSSTTYRALRAEDGAFTNNELGDRTYRLHFLCRDCRGIFEKSKIIQGSFLVVTRTSQKYKFKNSFADLRSSAGIGCHICTIVLSQFSAQGMGEADLLETEQTTPNPPCCRRCRLDIEVQHDPDRLFVAKVVVIPAKSPSCAHPLMLDAVRQHFQKAVEEEPLSGSDTDINVGDYVVTVSDQFKVRLECENHKMPFKRWPTQYELHEAAYCLETGSKSHMALARYWLTECQAKHKICTHHRRASTLPSRLLNINAVGNFKGLRIVNAPAEASAYACLSHCWGGISDILRLNKHNEQSLYSDVAMASLPKSFQDAVTIARSLGVEYLWIDCLCIMQDDPSDWARESAKMGSIFNNATITIAASGAANPQEGCFRTRNPLEYMSCKIAGHGDSATVISRFSDTPNQWEESTLTSRGWCHQEQVLSTRMLFFGRNRMSWRCMMGEAQEDDYFGKGRIAKRTQNALISRMGINDDSQFPDTYNDGPGKMSMIEDQAVFGAEVIQLDATPETIMFPSTRGAGELFFLMTQPWSYFVDPSFYSLHRLWMALVTVYSNCKLTQRRDKLVAISGLAERLVVGTSSSLTYFAGLWKECLTLDLLWFVKDPELPPSPELWRGPSWSWASVDGVVSSWLVAGYDRRKFQPMFNLEVGDIRALPEDVNATGQIKSAILRLRGRLKPSRVTPRLERQEYLKSREFRRLMARGQIPWDGYHLFKLFGSGHDQNEVFLGGLWPDHAPFDQEGEVHLMPICKAQRAENWFAMTPYWALWQNSSQGPVLHNSPYTICGIALLANSDETWSRVGMFHMNFDDLASSQNHWFDGVVEDTYTIV